MRKMRQLPVLLMSLALLLPWTAATAASAVEIDARADAVLDRLYGQSPEARALVARADGVLIFPRVIKAGIGIGGEYGEGVLRIGG